MTELEFQRILTVMWILCAALLSPDDWRLVIPLVGLLLEARDIYRSRTNGALEP